nr:hypothetical protein [Mesorhizobium sp.]
MTAAFQPYAPRASAQLRQGHPYPDEEIHPCAREMADAMLDIAARGCGGASVADLVQEGFTAAQIVEHHAQAKILADERFVTQMRPAPDLAADIVRKALEAIANRPPLPRGAVQTQAYLVDWRAYCAAHAALILDPWPSQRERCVRLLEKVLDRTDLFEAMRRDILAQVGKALAKVGQ